MATVRLSQQLHRDLVKTAEEKYQITNPKPNQSPELITEVQNALTKVPLFDDVQTLLNSIHLQTADGTLEREINSLRKKEVSDIRITGITKHSEYQNTGDTTSIEIELPVAMSLPAGGGYLSYNIHINMFDTSVRDALHTSLATAVDTAEAWEEKFIAFSKSIDSMISQCNTVKQLLEAWPGAEKLLPADVIQKLHKKVTRKIDAEKVRDTSNFDADAANQVLLTSSLLGD